jgi:hypothetical protein
MCVWNVKTKVIPVIIRTNGTIIESFRNERTTENGHIGQCIHTLERANVKVQNIQHGK